LSCQQKLTYDDFSALWTNFGEFGKSFNPTKIAKVNGFVLLTQSQNLVARGGIIRGRLAHRHGDFQTDWPTLENS